MTPEAPQRRHDLREACNALRWIVRTGAPWRYLPGTFPPWPTVHQQTQRWIATWAHGSLPGYADILGMATDVLR